MDTGQFPSNEENVSYPGSSSSPHSASTSTSTSTSKQNRNYGTFQELTTTTRRGELRNQKDDDPSIQYQPSFITMEPSSSEPAPVKSRNSDDDEEAGPNTDPVVVVQALRDEHNLTLWEALKLYPQAIGWSLFVSIGVIMLAFDPQIMGNMFAMPEFKREFGVPSKNGGENVIPAAWQTGLTMGSPLGQVVGALASAYPMEWFGRKWAFFGCVVLTTGLVFIQFFARTLQVLLAGELLCGLVLGCFVVIGPTYASEVCPMSLRGYLTSYTNLCFVTGQLLGNAVTAATSGMDNHWAYSIPFSLQWFWILVIIPGMFFIPESPWYLVRKGRMDEARDALRRLSSKGADIESTLAVIIETDRLEMEMEAGSTYLDTIKGVNLRRTEISSGVYITQVLCGVYLISYGTYFFEQAGLATKAAFSMGIGFLAVGWICTIGSWFLLARFGRRRIFNIGLTACMIIMLLVGILDSVPNKPSAVKWAESSLLLVWNGAYGLSVGPVVFVILGECSATRVRSKTIAAATAAQALVGIVMTFAIPYLINPDEANLQGKMGYFFGGLGALCLVWSYIRVPETMGRTFEELDILFDRRVPAREFKNYRILEEMEAETAAATTGS